MTPAAMPDSLKVIIPAILGGIVSLAVAAYFMPRLNARGLAEFLTNDLSRHMHAVGGALGQLDADPTRLPQRRPLLLYAYYAVTARLAELPPDLVGKVFSLYGVLERINESAASITDYHEDIARSKDQAFNAFAEREMARAMVSYRHLLENAAQRIMEVQPALYKEAFPEWSTRAPSSKPKALDVHALQKKTVTMQRQWEQEALQLQELFKAQREARRKAEGGEA